MGTAFSPHSTGLRAVQCAAAVVQRVRSLDLEICCGLHPGEIEVTGQDIAGIAVHIAACFAAQAQRGQVLVSSTVRDLAAGSGLRFADEGARILNGISDEVWVFSVAD